MKRIPVAEDTILVSCQLTLKEQRIRDLSQENPIREKEKKETPEEMVRSLQGVFCKGRYSSWVFSREKPHKKTTFKPPRGGNW